MKFTSNLFDYSRLDAEVKEEFEDFFIHYNNMVANLQIILNSGITIDNIAGQYKTVSVQNNVLTIVDDKARYGAIVAIDNEAESFKIVKTGKGIEVLVNFKVGDKGNVTLLLLN